MTAVPVELLQALAGQKPAVREVGGATGQFSLLKWIEDHALDLVEGPSAWNGGQRWVFRTCPWNSEHRDRSAFIIQFPTGAVAAGCLHDGCKDKDWRTLRDLLEPGRMRQPRETLSERSAPDGTTAWEPPLPFHEFRLPLFPVTSLPDWLRRFVEGLATATQTPPELAAMLSLSVIAASCAKKVHVRMKEGHFEPLNIYTVTALPSGNRKSAVFSAVIKPLEEYEAIEAKRMAPEIAGRQADQRIKESQLKKAQEQAAGCGSGEKEALSETARKLAAELAEIEVPSPTQMIVSDCTSEKLGSILRKQGGRIAVMSPEGEVFDLMAGRYSSTRDGNFDVFLKGHAGDNLRVDRVNRPTEFVKAPAVTLGLAVQPAVIQGLIERQGFRGKGLLARFLYSLPASLLGSRNTDPPPLTTDTAAEYHQNILSLLRLPCGVTQDGDAVPYILKLEPDARACMHQFEKCVEPKLSEFGELGAITDWGGKLVGAVGRIVGILHMAWNVDDSAPWDIPISLRAVEGAIEVGTYLISHAKAAFALMGADPIVEQAKAVLRWIDHHHLDVFSRRDLHQGMRGTLKRVEEVEPPLALLEKHGFIRAKPERTEPRPGRPASPTYDVNPLCSRRAGEVTSGEF